MLIKVVYTKGMYNTLYKQSYCKPNIFQLAFKANLDMVVICSRYGHSVGVEIHLADPVGVEIITMFKERDEVVPGKLTILKVDCKQWRCQVMYHFTSALSSVVSHLRE